MGLWPVTRWASKLFGKRPEPGRVPPRVHVGPVPPPSRPPPPPPAAPPEDDLGPPTETLDTAPVAPAHAVSAARAAAPGWPTPEEVSRLVELHDEDELAWVVGRAAPGAGREEVLFRYQLSRALYFGEHELPPLPQTAARIMELARSPAKGIADFARVVETDPALAKSVLWLANSTYYGATIKCTSLAQAMVRVGVREVERIALQQGLFQARVFRVYGQDDLVRELGAHGLLVALAAREVARRTGAPPEDAFLAGLFHDVGKLVVLGIVASVQRRLKRRAPQALIRAAFDAFHVAVGESACRAWKIPEALVRAVAHHHEPALAAETPLDRAVYLGNALVRTIERRGQELLQDDAALAASRLSLSTIGEIRAHVTTEFRAYQGGDPRTTVRA